MILRLLSQSLLPLTLLLAAALLAQWPFRRRAATRHAILFWALAAAGAAPLILPLWNSWERTASMSLRLPAPLRPAAELAARIDAPALPRADQPQGRALNPAAWLPFIWLAGTLLGSLRIGRGLWLSRRLLRSAEPRFDEHLAAARVKAGAVLGRKAPPLAISREAAVPMTVGLLRPIVLLPLGLAERLDPGQLVHVVVHESAHALRRDALVGLYQRVLAAVFWFHPLVHLSNRLLDQSREEVCDNHALAATGPIDYARTLLAVARSLGVAGERPLAAALLGSVHQLERRISQLLIPGRSAMTRLTLGNNTLIAAAFLAGAGLLTALAAAPPGKGTGYDLSHKVDFKVGATYLRDGDRITVDEVTGTSDSFSAGNMYVVKGTYKLASAESASLAAYVTVDSSRHRSVPTQNTQTMKVEQGEGRYSLIFYMWDEGYPHISFYPAQGGGSSASVYFGTGKTLLERGWWEKDGQAKANRPGVEHTHPPIASRFWNCAACHGMPAETSAERSPRQSWRY